MVIRKLQVEFVHLELILLCSCFDLGSILESHHNVSHGVNRDMIDHGKPVLISKNSQCLPCFQVSQKKLDLLAAGMSDANL